MTGESPAHMIQIRPAVPADASLIVRFGQALAEFEKEPAENVHLDEQKVLEHAFGASPKFEVLIAEIDRSPVGMALFFQNFSTWTARPGIWVEELFVEGAWRGRGVGRELLAAVARLAEERGCGRVELAVLDWNPAADFYRTLGFQPLEQWRTFRLDEAGIELLSGK